MQMFDVFISYRRSDGEHIAKELYEYLSRKGLRVFFDKEKLENGDLFPPQLERNLQNAPNYVLIATNDVFKFREGRDWVRNEIEIALKEYKRNSMDRTLTVLVPEGTNFPEEECLPENVREIADVQRIVLYDMLKLNVDFEKVFEVATRINRANLWNAAHRWRENSKKEKGRFGKLNVCESILPNVNQCESAIDIPIKVGEQSNEGQDTTTALMDAIAEKKGHLYLVGQGGIGKTTAFMHIMDNVYANGVYEVGKQIPIFVELSFAPDTYGVLYKTEVSSFIRRSIFRQIRTDLKIKQVEETAVDELDEIFSISPDVAVNPITDLFSHKTPAPEFLLLLDGLNEVSTVRLKECDKTILQMVVEEIKYLMNECPNVRVILSSRYEESILLGNDITKLYLQGVHEDAIKQYLTLNGYSSEKIEQICTDKVLMETLRIPLFLTMYVSLAENNEVISQGEILRLFFSERSKNLDIYTNQNRVEAIENNMRFAASEIQLNRVTAEMYHFILDFLLPELAWHMERNEMFYISAREVKKLMEPLLQNTEDLDICGDFGKDVFDKYRKSGFGSNHIEKVAQKLRRVFGENDSDDFRTITENILTSAVLTLGVLQESNHRYGFVHQHIRDYFAAVKIINIMRMSIYMYEEEENALALDCINQVLKGEPLNLMVRKFVGEYLGEHKNKPYYDSDDNLCYGVPQDDNDRSLLDRLLHVYRGYFKGEGGYGAYSILKILTEIRQSLVGCDLSQLDMVHCQLGEVELGAGDLTANIRGAKIDTENIFLNVYISHINDVDYSPDGTKFLTCTSTSIHIWDAKTGMHMQKINTLLPWGNLCDYAQFVGNSEIVFVGRNGGIVLTDINNLEKSKRLQLWDNRDFRQVKVSRNRGKNELLISSRVCILFEGNYEYKNDIFLVSLEDFIIKYQENDIMSRDNVWWEIGEDDVLISIYEKEHPENDTKVVERRNLFTAGGEVIEIELEGDIEGVARNGDDLNILISLEEEMNLYVVDAFNLRIKKQIRICEVNEERVCRLSVSDFGNMVIVLADNKAFLYRTSDYNLEYVYTTKCNSDCFLGVAFCESAHKMLLYSRESNLYIYDTNTYELSLEHMGASYEFKSCQFTRDGEQLVTVSNKGEICLWDMSARALINYRNLAEDTESLLSVDGEKIFCYSKRESLLMILSVPELKLKFSCAASGFVYDPQGRFLAVQQGGHCRILSVKNESIQDCHVFSAVAKAFIKDYVITEVFEEDKYHYVIVNAESGELLYELYISDNAIISIDVQGKFIALGFEEGIICLFDVMDFELVHYHDYKGLICGLREIRLDKTGDFLFEVLSDGELIIRKTDTMKVVYENSDRVGRRLLNRIQPSPLGDVFFECADDFRIIDMTTFEIYYERMILTRNTYGEFIFAVDYSGTKLVYSHGTGNLCVFLFKEYKDLSLKQDESNPENWSIPNGNWIKVLNLDFRELHPDSVCYKAHMKELHLLGARINAE